MRVRAKSRREKKSNEQLDCTMLIITLRLVENEGENSCLSMLIISLRHCRV